MDLGLKNKTALVLGAGGGLGRAVDLSLAREGAHVAVANRSADRLEKTYELLSAQGARCIALQWDLGDLSLIDRNIAEIEKQLGPVEVLINNTGGPPPTAAAGANLAVWEENFRTMVLSVLAISDRVLPGMRERKWGRILTLTSSGVVAPIPNLAISNALRLSLVGWSKTLAREVAGDGVTANVVAPGRIATDRISFLDQKRAEREGRDVSEVQRESTSAIPAGRYGDPEEFADVVTFLASERASYVTGSIIRVDGGLVAGI